MTNIMELEKLEQLVSLLGEFLEEWGSELSVMKGDEWIFIHAFELWGKIKSKQKKGKSDEV